MVGLDLHDVLLTTGLDCNLARLHGFRNFPAKSDIKTTVPQRGILDADVIGELEPTFEAAAAMPRWTNGERDIQTTPANVAARYAENLRRLAQDCGKMGRPALATSLSSVADLMEDMVDDIATNDRGSYLLRRVGRLVGMVECVLATMAKASILH